MFRQLGKFISAALLLLLFSNLSCKTASEPWIVADGIERFWDVHEVLSRDETPSEETWDAMFTAPGYRQLDRVERRSTWMKPILSMAYRPSLAKEAAERRASGDLIGSMLLPHLQMAGSNRAAIESFVEDFTSDETLEVALAEAQGFLPDGAVRRDEVPPVFLVIVDGDGKALPDGIVMDAFGISFWERPVTVLAHELHHVFRESIARVRKTDVASNQAELFRVIEQLEEEGVAEMIDKNGWASGVSELSRHPMLRWAQERYRKVMEEAPEAIRELDRGLVAVFRDSTAVEAEGKRLSELIPPFARHTVGRFMASTIDEALGRKRLIATVGNPFAFVRGYAEATGRGTDLAPPLSGESVALLRRWEEQYVDVD